MRCRTTISFGTVTAASRIANPIESLCLLPRFTLSRWLVQLALPFFVPAPSTFRLSSSADGQRCAPVGWRFLTLPTVGSLNTPHTVFKLALLYGNFHGFPCRFPSCVHLSWSACLVSRSFAPRTPCVVWLRPDIGWRAFSARPSDLQLTSCFSFFPCRIISTLMSSLILPWRAGPLCGIARFSGGLWLRMPSLIYLTTFRK